MLPRGKAAIRYVPFFSSAALECTHQGLVNKRGLTLSVEQSLSSLPGRGIEGDFPPAGGPMSFADATSAHEPQRVVAARVSPLPETGQPIHPAPASGVTGCDGGFALL